MTTIMIRNLWDAGTHIAVVERYPDGTIAACNHDGGTEFEDVCTPEFDLDSKEFVPTGTSRIESCSKCDAIYDPNDEVWDEPFNI